MAKKKQKKAFAPKGKTKGNDATAKASKLPKRIAGVKIPKPLRQSGGKLLEAVSHPLVMDIAAAALMAAAAKLRDEATRNAAAQQGAEPPGSRSPDIGAILAATAVEGLRKIADSALGGAKGAGGGNGRAPGDKGGGGS